MISADIKLIKTTINKRSGGSILQIFIIEVPSKDEL